VGRSTLFWSAAILDENPLADVMKPDRCELQAVGHPDKPLDRLSPAEQNVALVR
jgi:hypothetical protein